MSVCDYISVRLYSFEIIFVCDYVSVRLCLCVIVLVCDYASVRLYLCVITLGRRTSVRYVLKING